MTADFMLVSDNHYVKNLGICTYSAMHNMCDQSDIFDKVRLFVMDCGITEENRQKLRHQAARFDNAEIIFYDIDKKLDDVMPKVKTKWHRSIYGRLFLDMVVREYHDIDRIVYLDCDLLMDRPVTELFTMDLKGHCLAAVVDSDSHVRKQSLHMPPESVYINSGVLVIDTARWMEADASHRIIEHINSFPDELMYPDQDAINFILGDDILILPPEFNMMWMLCKRDIPKLMNNIPDFYYTSEQLEYALFNARIIHFAGHNMWSFDGITPIAARTFKKYRKLCDWRDCRRKFGSPAEFVMWCLFSVKRFFAGDFKIN